MKLRVLPVILILSLVIPFVSAQSFDFERARLQVSIVLDSMLGILAPFFELIIGDYSTSEFFFSKVLLLILLTIIVKFILEKTPVAGDNKKISLILGIIISVIAIRFINENNLFEAILIQYGVLGIAITTILPMVIFFYFIHNNKIGSFGRKVFWTLYAVIMIALWLSKSSELPGVANWIYILGIIAVIIFIIFDRTIHSYFGFSDFKKFERESNEERKLALKEKLDELNKHQDAGRINDYKYYTQRKEKLEKQIKELSKE